MGLSSFHFARLFKSSTGQSPYQYLLNQRLRCAKEYLRSGHLPIAEIAARLGLLITLISLGASERGKEYLLLPGERRTSSEFTAYRLPQMLVLIFENQHQRVLLRHVPSEQFHVCLQVVVGKSCNRFLQIGV